MRLRFLLVALAVAVLAAAAGACSDGSSGAAPPDLPVDRVTRGLCEAAAAGDTDDAERSFGAAHDGLHEIARALQEVDRKAAAALLEAKQEVEAGFHRRAPASELGPDLDRLVTATFAGLDRLDVNGDAACDQ